MFWSFCIVQDLLSCWNKLISFLWNLGLWIVLWNSWLCFDCMIKRQNIGKRIEGDVSTLFYTCVWNKYLNTMFLSLQFNQYFANFVQISLPDKKMLSRINLIGKMVKLLTWFLMEMLTGVAIKVQSSHEWYFAFNRIFG